VIPEQTSPIDQQDAPTLSHVTSSLRWRYCIRMTEMAQVCQARF
jgi:hypothetical protein